MRRVQLICLTLLLGVFNAISQDSINRTAMLSKYGQYIQPYIKGWHDYNYKDELIEMKDDFDVVATFQIDTKGKVVSLNIQKHIGSEKVTEYVSKLVMVTSGGWLPQIKKFQRSAIRHYYLRFSIF